MLDTLIEFVQGPCLANQLSLVNHKVRSKGCSLRGCWCRNGNGVCDQFVETVSKILQLTTAPSVPWASAEHADGVTKLLRLRCVTALVSLFEGRTDYVVHSSVVAQVCLVYAR